MPIYNIFSDYKTAFSGQRIEGFRYNGDDLDTLTRCLWNTCLSESFYPSLQCLEVGLRNAIHNALTFVHRTPLWFKQPFMCEMCRDDILDAEYELQRKGKDYKNPERIIAELKFGFWTRLFNKHYQQPLWDNKVFLLRTFPNATAQQRARHLLSARIDKIRRFRNRIFHHEIILSDRITEMHHDIIEMANWINPTLILANNLIDRFHQVSNLDYFNNLKHRIAPAE